MIASIRELLTERCFTPTQIETLLPKLDENFVREPAYLAEIIDTWNNVMANIFAPALPAKGMIPSNAAPPAGSFLQRLDINMQRILTEVEPDLLLMHPEKLVERHTRLLDLGLCKTGHDFWTVLFNAPRGFYMQDWNDLLKKVYYIDNQIVDFLFDKKDLQDEDIHPIVRASTCIEANIDHIRARYLFASKSGYKALAHMYPIQTGLEKPRLKDLLLIDNQAYLKIFAPFCTIEEYKTFAALIKNYDYLTDDIDVYEKLSELNSLGIKSV